MSRFAWAVAAVVVSTLVTPALAEDKTNTSRPLTWRGDTHVVVDTPVDKFTPHDSLISPYLYLNRCTGGCTVTGGGVNDARTNTSTIPNAGTYTVSEFKNSLGETGTLADAEWNQVVQCMKEVYSPFAVQVVDQRPANGVSYTMAIIAGNPSDVGLSSGILGIAPLAANCAPQDNVLSFSFANHHSNNNRVLNICWTAAQESAHAFGLDHEYMFSDGTSACNDPMTYRTDCGGEKFFRNKAAQCGENEPRVCNCGGQQNSHVRIRAVFGDGVSLIGPPSLTYISPTNGATITNAAAIALSAGSKRGVEKVELYLNNWLWVTKPGALFGLNGQENPAAYSIPLPDGVPDGYIDIVVKAYDDLGQMTESPKVTVTKGAPCTNADSCAKGQKCEAGYCFWDPPQGQVGDSCTYPQFCMSGICADTSGGDKICSQACIMGVTDSCPMGYQCETGGQTMGLCSPIDKPGCCSTTNSSRSVWVHGGLAALVLGFVVRRRRKR